MAKKTTSNRNSDPSASEAPKQTSAATPAKRAMADLAGSVKKKIKDTLTPKKSTRKSTPASNPETPAPASPPAPVPPAVAAASPDGDGASSLSAPPSAKPKRTSRGSSSTKARGGAKSNGETFSPHYTKDDVALRAYFLSEQRLVTGRPGNPEQDWIEAERQLAAEFQTELVPR